MVNAETVDKSAFAGEDAIVPLTHFPFLCRMENGNLVRVSKKAPTSENILSAGALPAGCLKVSQNLRPQKAGELSGIIFRQRSGSSEIFRRFNYCKFK